MKNKKLTLIVGAGASKELGLPVGTELRDKIASLLNITFDYNQLKSGDSRICSAIESAVRRPDGRGDINPHLHAAWRIRDAMPQAISIDNFIDNHQGDEKIELCGKLAIVRSILEAEKKSTIYVDPNNNRNQINFLNTEACWLNSFTRLLTENCRADDLEARLGSISFVIFNYDRCIEHYLYFALQNYYKISESRAAELLNSVAFFHPYGSVGALPWQGQKNVAPFGADVHHSVLLDNARQIKTFTEGTDPQSSEISEIRDSVATSDCLVFLGFAFHKLNMQLIRPVNSEFDAAERRRNFATAFGISKFDCNTIALEICSMRGCGPEQTEVRNDLTCKAIFSEFTRGISLV
jgi:hypothetical protein